MAYEANRCHGCWRALPQLEGDQTPNFCPHCQFPLKPVAGLYRLESKLGAGAFGTVYRSRHVHNDTTHAVKIMRWDVVEELAPDYWGRKQKISKQREFEQRFEQEVELTRELAEESWHIVRIDDAGSDPVHGLYYVMELLEGAPLFQFVQQWPAMSRRIAFSVMEQVCLAVCAAHNKGIIHRDLKPDNVVILQQEDMGRFVKILDFGIAKVMGSHEKNLTSRPVGTPLYMAPEQCANREVDQRTDIYALGCLFYHLIAGQPPFDSSLEIPQLMLNHVQYMPPTLQERCPHLHIPRGLDQAVMRSLAKAPDARYSTVEEFWAAIHPFSQWQEDGGAHREIVGADTIVSTAAVVEPTPSVPGETPEPVWSLGVSSWEHVSAVAEPEVLWEERQFRRSSGVGWGGFLFAAFLLAGLWWLGTHNTPPTPKTGTLTGTLSKLPSSKKPSTLTRKPAMPLGASRRNLVASTQTTPEKKRLSRLERFLRTARQKKTLPKPKKVSLSSARKRKKKRTRVAGDAALPHVIRPKRVKRRTRIAGVSLPKQVGWPGAQRVGVPAGRVMTGAASAASNASIGRVLSLGRGFWMWRTEVSQAQFQSVMGYNPSHFKSCKRCPVENVTWHEAAAFSNAISRLQNKPQCYECSGKGRNSWCMVKRAYWGKQYYRCKGWRLPTETEWEYAYRAGSPAPFYAGKCLTSAIANYNGKRSVGDCPKGRYRNRTMPVGSFQPNAWGMYDMAGNVWEWVYDSHKRSLPSGHNSVRVGSSSRVVRGGGWYSSAQECSAIGRESFSTSKRAIILGFRPARTR